MTVRDFAAVSTLWTGPLCEFLYLPHQDYTTTPGHRSSPMCLYCILFGCYYTAVPPSRLQARCGDEMERVIYVVYPPLVDVPVRCYVCNLSLW